jgi:hypothetical protein
MAFPHTSNAATTRPDDLSSIFSSGAINAPEPKTLQHPETSEPLAIIGKPSPGQQA